MLRGCFLVIKTVTFTHRSAFSCALLSLNLPLPNPLLKHALIQPFNRVPIEKWPVRDAEDYGNSEAQRPDVERLEEILVEETDYPTDGLRGGGEEGRDRVKRRVRNN